jgi:ferric iron reductase protein FhuF
MQSPDGQTIGLDLRHSGWPLLELDALSRFATLLDSHMAPLIDVLAAATGASPKVFLEQRRQLL